MFRTLFKISIYLILLCFTASFAQDFEKVDSLKQLISKHKNGKDTLPQIQSYYDLGVYLSDFDPKESNLWLEKALKLAKSSKREQAEHVILNVMALNYSNLNEIPEALKLYEDVAEYFKKKGDKKVYATVLMNYGTTAAMVGKYTQAIESSTKALSTLLETGDSTDIAHYYCEIGKLFNLVGNREKYKEYILTAEKLIPNEKYANFETVINVNNELAFLYDEKNDFEKAKLYYQKNYELSEKKGYLIGIAVSANNIGDILLKQKKYITALPYIREGLEINKKLKNYWGLITSYISLGQNHFYLKNFNEAEMLYRKALSLAKNGNYPIEKKDIYFYMRELYELKNQYDSAYFYFKKYEIIKDSLENLDVKKQIAQMETQFNTKQKERQIEFLDKENELKDTQLRTQGVLFVILLVAILLASLVIYLIVRNKRIQAELNASLNEQKMLRVQLNPHFIFNSLNAIQNFILQKKPFEAADYLSDFARLMRLILESSREDSITLEKEIQILDYYLKLQQLRFSNSFSFEIKIDENLIPEQIKIPSMLLQPFIENAVEHGIKNMDFGKGVIFVEINEKDDSLLILVEDNGHGFSNEIKENHKSYAIKITQERIENIYLLTKKKIKFEIQTEVEKGTKIIFEIPKS